MDDEKLANVVLVLIGITVVVMAFIEWVPV